MAKITIQFDSTEEAQDALNGSAWKMLVWNLDQKLRQITKYDSSIIHKNQLATEVEIKIAEQYREIILEMVHEYGLKLDVV